MYANIPKKDTNMGLLLVVSLHSYIVENKVIVTSRVSSTSHLFNGDMDDNHLKKEENVT